jgi:spore maturation protein CgeB
MRDRAEFLGELARRLEPHGISASFLHSEGMPLSEQVDFIQRSRINLNYSAGADEGTEKSWGLPERCYGVQACGGFLLSDNRRHAADDFRLGDEWVAFESLDDCVAKIRHYVAHFDEARRIAEAAHARVMREHTYVNRARTLMDAAIAWKDRRHALR